MGLIQILAVMSVLVLLSTVVLDIAGGLFYAVLFIALIIFGINVVKKAI